MTTARLKAACSTLLENGPYSLVRASIRYTNLFSLERYYRKLTGRIRYGESAADPYTILEVDPSEISYWAPHLNTYDRPDDGLHFSKHEGFNVSIWNDAGAVVGGDWDSDENTYRIENTPKYTAVRDHFVDDVPWEETEMFDIHLQIIDEHGSYDGCKNRHELRERYESLDDIYIDIKENGYKPQRELVEPNTRSKVRYDEIGVGIGRDGKLIFIASGWHRLAIAKILEVKTVFVRIILRHERWQEIRSEIVEVDEYEELSSRARRNISHPDLRDIVPTDWRSRSRHSVEK